MQNEWKYFITLTLDQNEIDRTDITTVTKKFKKWLDNAVQRHDFRYLFVFEHHKDKQGIHMHGVANDSFLQLSKAYHLNDDGTYRLDKLGRKIPMRTKKGIQVYNIDNWKYGYSRCIELYGDPVHVAKYITKYITKDSEKIAGHYYYAGGKGLVRKPLEYVFNLTDSQNLLKSPYFDSHSDEELTSMLLDLAIKTHIR